MAPPRNVEVGKTVKFEFFAPQGHSNELIQVKYGVEEYTMDIFMHACPIYP